jgi:hypothetical protein
MPPALKRIILDDLYTALKGRSSTTSSRSSAKNAHAQRGRSPSLKSSDVEVRGRRAALDVEDRGERTTIHLDAPWKKRPIMSA